MKTPRRPDKNLVSIIRFLRGRRVILDFDLASIYGVTTKRLNEQVKRNGARFPPDFIFKLTAGELADMNWSQIATSSQKHRRSNSSVGAFTEHGAVMAATVLNSPLAIDMSLYVVRAFIETRALLSANKELAMRLEELESNVDEKFGRQDRTIAEILIAIRQLMVPPPVTKRGIGFTADIEPKK